MNLNFEFIANLQYKVKNLSARVRAFESGDKYITMKSEFKTQLSGKDQEIRRLKIEVADAHCETVTARKNWIQVFDDLENEHVNELQIRDREIEALKTKLQKTEDILAETMDKLREKIKEQYQSLTELEEEKGKNLKLKAQINRDYENSSIPSSRLVNRKKIPNSREKTGRKPGGQPGHKGHGRRKLSPTNKIHIPAPKEYEGNPNYRLTGRTITKQVINLSINVAVDEYDTPEFRDVITGQRVHADFPDGAVNDVNYGGSVKAFAFLLNSRCCVSIDKVREFLSGLTNGELQISKGMISGLCKAFSQRTEAEQRKAFADILLSPVMNTDFTNARLNGKNVQIAICATPDIALYFAREYKGHAGVKGTPVEEYQGILVHDHDKTFYNYGDHHQECMAHPIRYLKDSMINEPDLKWNTQMRGLIQEMIHHRNSLSPDAVPDSESVKEYERRYAEILALAKEEYEYEPPSVYYKDGYNLYKRLDKYMVNHLLFLHDMRIPTSNNLAERLLRVFKRKQKQVMAFRSFDSIDYLCNCMGMIELLRSQGQNLYSSAASVFEQ